MVVLLYWVYLLVHSTLTVLSVTDLVILCEALSCQLSSCHFHLSLSAESSNIEGFRGIDRACASDESVEEHVQGAAMLAVAGCGPSKEYES